MFSNLRSIFYGAFSRLAVVKYELIKAVLFPVIALLAIQFFLINPAGADFGLVMLMLGTQVIFHIVLAITTHRVILLGPESVPRFGLYVPGKKEFVFLGYGTLLGLLMIPLGLIGKELPVVGYYLMALVYAYIFSRLSLIFPAIAIEEPCSFGYSWRVTENHQFSMLAVVALVPALVSIPERFMASLPTFVYAGTVLSVITTVLTVSLLSSAYKILVVEGEEANK